MGAAISILAGLPLQGLGTDCLESFLSLLHRTARLYGVKTGNIFRLLAAFDAGREYKAQNIDTHVRLLGYSDFALRMMTAFSLLSGVRLDTQRAATGTLLALRGVLARNGTGLFASRCRWCPECLNPDLATGYGMLAHELLHVHHCPLHGCALMERCANCGAGRRHICDAPDAQTCSKCGTELWLQSINPKEMGNYERWAEQQTLELVAYLAKSDREPPSQNWFREFCEGLAEFNRSPRSEYSKKERDFFRDLSKRAPYAEADPLPRWDTVLRVAALQSLQAIDLILSPKQALSSRLLSDQKIPFQPMTRVTTPDRRLLNFEALLERLLATDESVILPTARSLSKIEKVPIYNGFFRASDVFDRYKREHARREAVNRSYSYARAFKAAMRIVDECRRDGSVVQIRADGARLSSEYRVPKGVAESALHAAAALRQGHP